MIRFCSLVLVACSLLASCGEDPGFAQRPVVPAGTLIVVNAIPESPDLTAISNNTSLGNLGFGQATAGGQVLPQIPIDFSVVFPNNGVSQTVVAEEVTLAIGDTQTIILTGTIDNPTSTSIVETPFDFTAGTTDTRIKFFNASSNIASATVNLTNPNGADATVVMTNGQPTGFTTTTAGEALQIEITNDSDSAVLWRSGEFNVSAAASRLFMLVDYFGPGTETVRMISINDPFGSIFVNEQLGAAVRFINQTANQGALDFFVDDNLTASIGFNTVTSFIPLPPGTSTVRVTPAGVPGTELSSTEQTFQTGFFHTLHAASNADGTAVTAGIVIEERRRIATQARINITKLAPSTGSVDLYFQDRGESLTGNPDLNQLTDFGSGSLNFAPKEYDLFVTDTATTNVLVGPTPLTIAAKGIYTLQLTDSVGGGAPIQLQLLDDFQD